MGYHGINWDAMTLDASKPIKCGKQPKQNYFSAGRQQNIQRTVEYWAGFAERLAAEPYPFRCYA